jgi:CxxC motif-containing protein (DUF1111 family)
MDKRYGRLVLAIVVVASLSVAQTLYAQFRAKDPGVRAGASAGGPITGLTTAEREMFDVGRVDFSEEEEVDEGVGPRFNFVSCAGCHAQPAVGGTSPAVNPLFRVTADLGFSASYNAMPSFISPNGPVREARFQYNSDGSRDGGVHALFVISGHEQAAGCGIQQEDFERQVRNDNIAFRIPTPVFGAGLIEQISDGMIVANLNSNSFTKRNLGITGRVNRNGNDGTITRFGWKAQNKSLLLFSGEAYNVEMGITSELFQQERDETPSCQFATVPNDVTASVAQIGAIENFANFQRFLAPPAPSADRPGGSFSIARGRQRFSDVGCVHCHTPSLKTGNATVAALRFRTANLYSDLALHQMGPGLADDVLQGGARADEFRTAPLWGLGQRIFFLHDGRTTDLVDAIRAHRSVGNFKFGPSEANEVVDRFNALGEGDKQDLLNFLRSL